MGNWKNRRFSNRFRKSYESYYDDPPPSPPPSPPKPGIDDGVPLWEKNFCYYIGSIPWHKVVNAKKFMYCHNNVANWDDSAGKEAFQNAKDRYWAEINGLPCEGSLPDRDTYTEEINWNPDIDPDLIKDLELSFFAPADEERDSRVGGKSRKTRKLVPYHPEEYNKNPTSSYSGGCKSNAANANNPWESDDVQTSTTLMDNLQGCDHWNSDMNNSANLKADDNPWECGSPPGGEAVKTNNWGHGENKLWGWNQGKDHVSQFDNWKNDGDGWQSTCHAEDKGWGDNINSSWGCNQQEPRKLHNGDNSWQNSRSFNKGSGFSENRGWRDNGGQGWELKQHNTYHKDPNNLGPNRSNSSWGGRNKGYWERRGTHHPHTTSYRSAQFAGDYHGTTSGWDRRNTKKRVNFAIE